MSSIACQNSWVLSNSSPVAVANDEICHVTVKAANFVQIPSWVSLKCTRSSVETNKNQRGQVENLHLVSLAKQGKLTEVQEFIRCMDDAALSVTPQSYESLFRMCAKLRALEDGKLFHNRL